MKYALIDGERPRFPVPMMCRILEVSRSGYYKWRARKPTAQQARREAALQVVHEVFEASRRTYGSPRVHRELQARGHRHSRRFISTLMRHSCLRACASPRGRVRNASPVRMTGIGNVLQRKFSVENINEVWAADFTAIKTRHEWLYLAVVLDLASRRVIGWSMQTDADETLTSQALSMALGQRNPKRGLLHHSDRGTQYCSLYYLKKLEEASIRPSLSRPGNCLDNAVVESFFHTLKVERIHCRPQYRTTDEARQDLFDYIEVWYNRQRRHSTLGYLSPVEYEATL